MDFNQNHFELFGLPVCFGLDAERLEHAYHELQTQIHPDRFAHAGDAEQRLAMQWATRVNEAYQTLRRPFERARYLLQLQGIDALDPNNTSMPPGFLVQQMDWREAVADASAERDMTALQGVERELRAQSRAMQDELGSLMDVDRDYATASEVLRKMRFMDKLLEEVDAVYEDLE